MGGGDEKPPLVAQTEPVAAAADTPAVVLEVRPEFNLIAPCGPPGGNGPTRDEVMVMARIRATRESDADRRAPVNICTVIDRSESMKANLPLVKQSLEFMVQHLRDEDQLSVIAFDHEVSTVLPMTFMTMSGKELAKVAIGKLKERGQTNLSGGLLAALQQFLLMKPKPDETARIESVLLFTDGKANRGVTDGSTLARATRSVIGQIGRPLSVFTFGFGEEHEASVLQSIADAGNGLYYYVEDVESIPDSFCDCLGGLLSVTAQNISLELTGCNGHTLMKPLTTFSITSTEENSHTVQIPDIYSEESKDVLVNVSLCIKGEFDLDNPRPLPTEIAQFHLRYFDVQLCKLCTFEATACVEILPPMITAAELGMADVQERLTTADSDVSLQRIRQATNEALRDADRLAAVDNDRASANQRLDQCVEVINASPLAADPYAQHQIMTLVTAKAGISDQRSYKKWGAKQVRGLAHANEQQRSNTTRIFASDEQVAAMTSQGVSTPAAPASVSAPRLPSQLLRSSAACGSDRRPDAGGHPVFCKKTFNPYRGKKKAAMIDEYWQSKGGRPKEEE